MSKRCLTLLAAACAVGLLTDWVLPRASRAALELVVDDDAVECPAATHATIRAAIDAVPAGADGNVNGATLVTPVNSKNAIVRNTLVGFAFPCVDQGTNTSTALTCSHREGRVTRAASPRAPARRPLRA